MINKDTEENVLKLRDEGYSYSQISKILGLTKSTVVYFAKRHLNKEKQNRILLKEKEQKEFEDIVCQNVKDATSISNLCILVNKRPTNNNIFKIQQIIDKYNLDISHFSSINTTVIKNKKKSFEEIFCLSLKPISTHNLKRYLFKYNIKQEICECCKNSEWMGQKIPLQLHHINGNRLDNRIENLQLLCPNCHAQTDNYAGKNINSNIKKKYKCICCGKEFYMGEGSSKYSNIYCSIECKNKMSNERNKYVKNEESIERPLKEQLIEDYRELGGWKKIALKYKVSDNAIKKWFKKYNLPCTVKEIRKYIINLYGEQRQWYDYMFDENGDRKHIITKEVDVYDLEGNFIKTYKSIKQAQNELGLNGDCIRRVCNGKFKKYKNYIFKYH